MNILPINNLKLNNQNVVNRTLGYSGYGIQMYQPLMADTVSFKSSVRTNKNAGKAGDMIRENLAKQIDDIMKEPHRKLNVFLEEEFGDLINKGWVTLDERIKGHYSMRLKTGSRKWPNKKSILTSMNDVSGFCFVLEDKRAFNECMNRLIKLIKQGKLRIAFKEEIGEGRPVEYHVIAPKYKRGEIVESYDSLNVMKLQELKKAIIDKYHPVEKMSDTVDSISGYSGLHVIVKNPDGTFSEIKFLTRAMADVQKVENLLYKVRGGKPVDPKYAYLEDVLVDLKPLDEYASEEEIKEQEKLIKPVVKYTLEVYKDALKHPFVKDAEMPHPSDPIIAKYDFNKLKKLMIACENM